MIVGTEEQTSEIRQDIIENPLTINQVVIKEKSDDKYLGDTISSDGLSDSVYKTVKNRVGKIKQAIKESKVIIEDLRMNIIGGTCSGIDLWEVAILPAALTNCETWVEIDEKTIDLLEDLQTFMYRSILSAPATTPIPALCFELGGMKIKYRIMSRKLNFFYHLLNLPAENLAFQIVQLQLRLRLPGLAKECMTMIADFKLPDISKVKIAPSRWKNLVKKVVTRANEEEMKASVSGLKKLQGIKEDKCQLKSYFSNLSLYDARVIFSHRTMMMKEVKANYKSDANNMKSRWKCESCKTCVDTNKHVLWCSAYSQLRLDKDLTSDKDLCEYLQKVMLIRTQSTKS